MKNAIMDIQSRAHTYYKGYFGPSNSSLGIALGTFVVASIMSVICL